MNKANKFMLKFIVGIILVATLITTSVVFAYFQFAGDKKVEITAKATISASFGKIPVENLPPGYVGDPNDTWGLNEDNPFLIQTLDHYERLVDFNNEQGFLDELVPDGSGGWKAKYYFQLAPEDLALDEVGYDSSSKLNILDLDGNPMPPIGTAEHPFNCVFNGAGGNGTTQISSGVTGYMIQNLEVEGISDEIDIGMFGYIGPYGEVHDLILNQVTIKSYDNSFPNPIPVYHDDPDQWGKTGSDRENCHIGILVGHLDGNAYNISVKDSNIDFSSTNLDYYSKFSIIGFCGDLATINGIDIDETQKPSVLDGDFGFWFADHIFDFIGSKPYYDVGDDKNGTGFPFTSTQTGYLTGTGSLTANTDGAARKVGSQILFRQGVSIPSLGIFNLHTPHNRNYSTTACVIEPLVFGSGVNNKTVQFIRSTGANVNYTTAAKIPVDLQYGYGTNPGANNYNPITQKDEYFLKDNLFDPWKEEYISEFRTGLFQNEGINGASVPSIHGVTGMNVTGASSSPPTNSLHFSVKGACKVILVCQAASANTLHVYQVRSNNVGSSMWNISNLPNSGVTSGQLVAVEIQIQPGWCNATNLLSDGKYHFCARIDANSSNRVALALVPGEDPGSQDHVNTQKYKKLPTIDFIYDLAWPVTRTNYQHSEIVSYFTMGTHSNGNIVNELKVEYRRSGMPVSAGGSGVSFNMYADGADKDTVDSVLGSYLLNYVNNKSDDILVRVYLSGSPPVIRPPQ